MVVKSTWIAMKHVKKIIDMGVEIIIFLSLRK